MLKSLQSYFYIGQNQRKGIALTCLCILSYGLFRHFYIQYHMQTLPDITILKGNETQSKEIINGEKISLNTISTTQLINIGFKESLASRMLNYRDKIGGFKNWDQVEKVYGITSDQLNLLKSSSFIKAKDSWNSQKKFPSSSKKYSSENSTKIKPVLKPASFDPNLVTLEELESMGLNPKISKGIVNFRKAGFKYKSAEDLKRIYTMDEKSFNQLLPFVDIKSEKQIEKPQLNVVDKTYTKKINIVDINVATLEQLDQLPGIGPGYANMILKWRNKLGGFHSADQIKSTYNLPDSVFQNIKQYIVFKTEPTLISINTCDEYTLAKHFYIRSKEAKIIVAYRSNHGPFRSKEDLLKTGALDTEWVEKVSPYLNFK